MESHYNLPVKDHAFLEYVENYCSNADYVFKGDDDILLVPRNLATLIDEMEISGTDAMGCLKKDERVNREITSKYFMPDDLIETATYSSYYSGAGYVLRAEVALGMSKAKAHQPL